MLVKKNPPMQMLQIILTGAMIFSIVIFSGCKSTKTVKGGAIGATAGGVVGGIIGKKKGNTAIGAIIGATVGGTAGALIGKYMDRQAKELEKEIEGAEVERVGEGILITFDSGLLFEFGSYKLSSATRENLANLSETLKEYQDTEVRIEGHTDNVGSDDYNQKLSEKRANAVSSYIKGKGISSSRLQIEGYGESQPVETNETDSGRQANRRVEIAIFANDELKKKAKSGELK